MSYSGIDYGNGQTNIDRETGIRYGIIPLHRLAHWAIEEFEMIFDPHCPHCGTELTESQNEIITTTYQIDDYGSNCPHCGEMIDDGGQYGEQPSATVYNRDGLQMFVDSSNDVWITKSSVTTLGQFCSPCAPGAVSIYCEGSIRAYCLPSDWFDDGQPMPYTILIPQSAIA